MQNCAWKIVMKKSPEKNIPDMRNINPCKCISEQEVTTDISCTKRKTEVGVVGGVLVENLIQHESGIE